MALWCLETVAAYLGLKLMDHLWYFYHSSLGVITYYSNNLPWYCSYLLFLIV